MTALIAWLLSGIYFHSRIFNELNQVKYEKVFCSAGSRANIFGCLQ